VRIGDAYEIFEDCIFDIAAAVDFVSEAGYSEVHLSGHSLGSPKVAYYASEGSDTRIKSVIFLSPSDMVGLTMADKNYKRDMDISRKMVAEGKGDDILPFPALWGESPLSAKTYISLGSEDSKVAIFNFYNPHDPLLSLTKITIPALAVMGRKDDALVVSIEETMGRIKRAMTNSPKVETNILGDADHGYNNYEQQLSDVVLKWIKMQ
jgi:pimeloyl-ACP methyl ester carboxylesterase